MSISLIRSHYLQQDFKAFELISQTKHTEFRLNQTVQTWRHDAHHIAQGINFAVGNLSQTQSIDSIIVDYINAESQYQPFEWIAGIDSQEKLIVMQGCSRLSHIPTSLIQPGIMLMGCHTPNELPYVVISEPIVISNKTPLTLYFAKQLNEETLALIAPRSSLVQLEHDGKRYPNQLNLSRLFEDDKRHKSIDFSVKWPGSTDTRLHVYKSWSNTEAYWFVFIPPLIALSAAFLIIWLSFGAWTRKISLDITQLNQSAQSFSQTQDLTLSHRYLSPLLEETNTSETNQLAREFWHLMQRINQMLEQEKTFTETLTLLEEAIITLDSTGQILESSHGWRKLTRSMSLVSHQFMDYVHPNDRDGWLTKFAQLTEEQKELIHIRFRLNTLGQAHPWIEAKFLCHHQTNQVKQLRGALRDVTQSYLHEKQITHMALHDALTGVANRILLEDRLKQAIETANRHQRQLAIVFFDLDHFKQINDSLGHKVGDQLLLAVSKRIEKMIRMGDTLARWGGDEFVILFSDIETEAISAIADKLLHVMQTPLKLEEHELSISYSMGVALYPQDAQDIQGLFANADRAMFHAKSQGRNQVCFYADMNYQENGKQELYIQNRLADAIKKKQIDVYYQPIIDSESNRVISVEALARWQDARFGAISPTTFIPMIENNGLTCQFGEHIIQQALQTMIDWREQGVNIRMAINISSRQLFAPTFIPNLLHNVNQLSIATHDIVLEVTESLALRDVDHAIEHLLELRNLGFKVSIDDFGTGHSSLSQLQEISADKLKIDRRFIQQLNTDKGYAMVLAIQHMAQALGLKTVAEGVETIEQLQMVKQMGITFIQGYFYTQPLNKESCLAWIQQHHASCPA